MKKLFAVLLILTLALSFSACTKNTDNTETTMQNESSTETIERTDIGSGSNSFFLTVTYVNGSHKYFQVHTDKEILGDALLENDLVEGEEGPYGLYIKTVCDEFHEYETDQKYWAFYENGAYASTGVDGTEIVEGSDYELRVE